MFCRRVQPFIIFVMLVVFTSDFYLVYCGTNATSNTTKRTLPHARIPQTIIKFIRSMNLIRDLLPHINANILSIEFKASNCKIHRMHCYRSVRFEFKLQMNAFASTYLSLYNEFKAPVREGTYPRLIATFDSLYLHS